MLIRERPSKISPSNVFENSRRDRAFRKFKSCSSRGTAFDRPSARICFNPNITLSAILSSNDAERYARHGEENYSQSDLFRNSNRELHISHFAEKETG